MNYLEPEGEQAQKMKQNLGAVEPGAEEILEWCLKVPQLPPTMHDAYTMTISYTLRFMVKTISQQVSMFLSIIFH